MKIEFKKVSRNGRNNNFVSVSGSETLPISDIAQQLCVEWSSVMRDVTRLPDNERILNYVWTKDARPYIKAIENDTDKRNTFRTMFGVFRDGDATYDEAKDGAIRNPSDYINRDLKRYPYGISLAVNTGARYQDWRIDLQQGPLILTPEFDQSKWQQCRASNSVAGRETVKVTRYKNAVQNLAPYLDQMEHLIDRYEEAAQGWEADKTSGQPYLQGLAMVNLIERMTEIYSRQDSKAETTNALAKEMLEHCGELVQKSLLSAVRRPLKDMAALYFDKGLAKALFEYLKLWDPSDHYYFHTVVANSIDAPRKKQGKSNNFDDRFFQAVDNFTRYLSADAATAGAVAKEANRLGAKLAPIVTDLGKQGKLASTVPLQNLLDQAEKYLSDVQSGGDTGILSVLATWSGYIGSWLGTMEGPPTVAGLIALHFSKSNHFVIALEQDTLLNSIQLIGVDKSKLAMITELVRRGGESDLQAARDLFIRSSWRSRTIFVAFALLGAAALVYHLGVLYQKLSKDGDQHKFDADLAKLLLYITSDVSNLGLVALTFKYNRDLDAFLTSNMRASTQAITARVAAMDAGGWRVVAVGVFHKGVTIVGVVLSLWDFDANWSRSDAFEKVVLFGTVAASLGMFLGALGITSWLGPAGAVVGVVLGVAMVAYQWFKTGFENTLRGLLDGYDGTALCKDNVYYPVSSKQVYIILTKTRTLDDLRDELSDSIKDFHWKDPWIGHAVEYVRAGITDESLAKIYDTGLGEITKAVNDQWYALEKYQARTVKPRIELLLPDSGAKLAVGVLSPVRVAVYDGDNVDYAFLEAQPQWYDGEPDRFLSDNLIDPSDSSSPSNYDVDRKSVILYVESQRTKNVSVFHGNLRIQEMPPGKVARFYIKAPKRTTKWTDGHPDSCKAQLLVEFPVTS